MDESVSVTPVVNKGAEPTGVWSPFGFVPACYDDPSGAIQKKHVCGECDDVYGSTELLLEHLALDHVNFAPYRCTFTGCDVGRYSQQRLAQHIKAKRHGSHNTFLYKDDPAKRALLLEMAGIPDSSISSSKRNEIHRQANHSTLHNAMTSSLPPINYHRRQLQPDDGSLQRHSDQYHTPNDVTSSSATAFSLAISPSSYHHPPPIDVTSGAENRLSTRAPPGGEEPLEPADSDMESFRQSTTPFAPARQAVEPRLKSEEDDTEMSSGILNHHGDNFYDMISNDINSMNETSDHVKKTSARRGNKRHKQKKTPSAQKHQTPKTDSLAANKYDKIPCEMCGRHVDRYQQIRHIWAHVEEPLYSCKLCELVSKDSCGARTMRLHLSKQHTSDEAPTGIDIADCFTDNRTRLAVEFEAAKQRCFSIVYP